MSVEVPSLADRAALHHALGDPARLKIVDALAVSDRTPGELRRLIEADWNLLAFHLRVLEEAGAIVRHVSEGDRRRRYVSLRARRLDGLDVASEVPHVHHPLFVCTHNSARSQFAAALWHQRTGQPAESAGSDPAPAVHPLAVEAAGPYRIDLGDAKPRGYAEVPQRPGVVVSVCDRALEAQPPFDAPTLHWSVPDPAGGRLRAFVRAFTDIAARVDRLVRLAA